MKRILGLLLIVCFAGCEGPTGPAGPAGETIQGEKGDTGDQGLTRLAPGLGFRHFGRFEGLAKSDQQECTEMYRIHADFGHEIQVGYEHFGGK